MADLDAPKPRGFARIASLAREAARKHHSPHEVGAAVGTGVFIGCSPFFGFHSLIAACVSWLCGLNFIYVWMGTHISNPFFAAFLTAVSIAVGGAITGSTRSTIAQWSVDWLVGSVVVGAVLGTIAGVATFLAVRRVGQGDSSTATTADQR